MIAIGARRAARVHPEQQACFDELGSDLRDVAADPAVATAAIATLAGALTSRAPECWADAVRAIGALLAQAPHDAPGGARRRLARFVAENADLLARA